MNTRGMARANGQILSGSGSRRESTGLDGPARQKDGRRSLDRSLYRIALLGNVPIAGNMRALIAIVFAAAAAAQSAASSACSSMPQGYG